MSKIAWIFITIVIFYSCEKEKTNSPPESSIYFTGITNRDVNGLIFSSDTTDWRTDDTWLLKESGLFPLIHTMCSPQNNNQIIAYPNPCNGIFSLHIEKEPTTRVELRLVDQDFNILISNDSILQNNVQLNAGTFGIKDTIRLYYKFIDGNCEWKGHGDIIIQ